MASISPAIILLISVMATLLTAGKGASADPNTVWLQKGIDMFQKTFYVLCWHRDLKLLPYGKHALANQFCFYHTKGLDSFRKHTKTEEYLKFVILLYTPRWLEEYHSKCEKFLKDPKGKPETDESDVLNDKKEDYPFKAYWYCTINELRKLYGNGAIEDIKKEVTHSIRGFLEAFLSRENEFRARHGSPPVKLDEQLNKDAQEWAEQMAKDCKMYHSSQARSDKNMGGYTGENLCARCDLNITTSEPGYSCANSMYKEIEFYPFPEGSDAHGGSRPPGKKYGHFTQIIWKGVKKVGYGVAENQKCPVYKIFIAARYFPGGNILGEFSKHVIQPKDYNPKDYKRDVSIDNLDIEYMDKKELARMKAGMKMFRNVLYTMCQYSKKRDFTECILSTEVMLFSPKKMKQMMRNSKEMFEGIDYYAKETIPHGHSKCKKYLKDEKAPVKDDESGVLNDKNEDYPFKAFWHCMIHIVREEKGGKVMEEIGERLKTKNEDWTKTILKAINKLRSLNGAKPLEIKDKLSKEAQAKADAMANSCNKIDGDSGELICDAPTSDAAFLASKCLKDWYEGEKKYREQIVSKKTTHIGFGEVIQPMCKEQPAQYIVLKFSPGVAATKGGERKNKKGNRSKGRNFDGEWKEGGDEDDEDGNDGNGELPEK